MESMERMERTCLIAVDGSRHSNHALNWFLKNIYKLGDKVILVHVVDHRKAFCYGTVSMVPGNPDSATHAYEQEEHKAHQLVTKLQEELSSHNAATQETSVPSVVTTDSLFFGFNQSNDSGGHLGNGISAEIRKVPGDVGETVVRLAKEVKADMVITGTRGHGQLRRTILGSVSTYILHHVDVPVIVCRHDSQ